MPMTKEREAEIRVWGMASGDVDAIPELLAALDAERSAHEETKLERDGILEGSSDWEESFHQAKALEKAAIEKWQRYKAQRDTLLACVRDAREALEEVEYNGNGTSVNARLAFSTIVSIDAKMKEAGIDL